METLPVTSRDNRQGFEKGKVMVRQGIFRFDKEFVAVKHFQVAANDFLSPGDLIDKTKFRKFHIVSMFRRRIIGFKDSLWAKSMIVAASSNVKRKPEIVGEITKTTVKKMLPEVTKKVTKTRAKAKPTNKDESTSK